MTYTDQGIILKRREAGEDSRIFHIYTKEHGKIEGAAQGVRKIKSKLAAHLEPLTLAELMFANGSRLERLIQARLLESFPFIKKDLKKIGQAAFMADLTDLLTKEGQKDERIFYLLERFLRILNQENAAANLEKIFAIKLLQLLGFELVLNYCVLCRRALDTSLSVALDPVKGGIICPACLTNAPVSPILLSSLTLSIVKNIFSSKVEEIAALELPELVGQELQSLTDVYTEAHLEFKPKSRYFLEYAYR